MRPAGINELGWQGAHRRDLIEGRAGAGGKVDAEDGAGRVIGDPDPAVGTDGNDARGQAAQDRGQVGPLTFQLLLTAAAFFARAARAARSCR